MSNNINSAPATNEQMTGAMVETFGKDSTINLPRQQKRVLLYLSRQVEGKSVIDMMKDLYISDPRGHISQLRKKGYAISDYWCETELGRHKRYYIRKEVSNGGI